MFFTRIITVIFFVILMGFASAFAANENKIDSLNSIISSSAHDTTRALTCLKLSTMYPDLSDTMFFYCEQALEIINKNDEEKNKKTEKSFLLIRSKIFNNIGVVYTKQGNTIKALDYFLRNVRIKEKIGNKKGIASSYNNIGYIYYSLNDTTKALRYFNKTLSIYTEIKNKKGIANTLYNIGSINVDKGELEKGLEYLQKALEIQEKINDKVGISLSLYTIGDVNYLLGNNIALDYLQRSLKLSREINDKEGVAYSLVSIGNIYLETGNTIEAKKYAQKSMFLSQKLGYPANIKNTSELLSKIYTHENNWKKGFEFYELYITMRDSINNQGIQKQAMQQEMKYQFDIQVAVEKKEREENKLLIQEKLKRQSLLIYSIIAIFIMAVFIAILMINKQRAKIKRDKLITDIQLKNTELEKRKLNDELTYTNRELTSFGVSIVQKNKFIENLKKDIKDNTSTADCKSINKITSLITQHLSIDKDIEEFQNHVEQVNQGFYTKLNNLFPSLSNDDKRICALLRNSLSSKDIATLFNISARGVEQKRYRLRKKLGIDTNVNIVEFLKNI